MCVIFGRFFSCCSVVICLLAGLILTLISLSDSSEISRECTCREKIMENVENSTSANQARRKNNFSIENILARPDSNLRENRIDVRTVKFMRQNPFQNNHVLFNHNTFVNNSNVHELRKSSENEIKVEESHLDIVESSDDHETRSENASDDGNSNSGNCKN